jgi:hypothetical protein
LRRVRACEIGLVFHDAALGAVPADILVTSPEFTDRGELPARYTADGEGLSPPLAWRGIPPTAKSLVILVEAADSPTPHPLVHAIVWAIAGTDGDLAAGALPPSGAPLPLSTSMGRNSLLTIGYLPPDPPAGHGTHRYAFEVFALRARPRLDNHAAPGRGKVLEWLKELAIAKGILIGVYERP